MSRSSRGPSRTKKDEIEAVRTEQSLPDDAVAHVQFLLSEVSGSPAPVVIHTGSTPLDPLTKTCHRSHDRESIFLAEINTRICSFPLNLTAEC